VLPGGIGKLVFGDGFTELSAMFLMNLSPRGCDDKNEIVERIRDLKTKEA